MSTGKDDDNSLCVYDWKLKSILGNAKVDKSLVTGLAWTSDISFVTIGAAHIKFWTITGKNIQGQKGVMTGQAFVPFTSIIAIDENCITGNISGKLAFWTGKNFSGKYFNAHEKAVTVLLKKENNFYSGGLEGRVIKWAYKGTA